MSDDTQVVEETQTAETVDDTEVFGDEPAVEGESDSVNTDQETVEQFETIANTNGDGTFLNGSAELNGSAPEDSSPAQEFAVEDVAQGEGKFLLVNYHDTEVVPEFNVRDMDTPETKAHIQGLYNKIFIDGQGLRDPWRGYFDPATGKFKLTAGHCRRAAVGMWVDGGGSAPLIPLQLEDTEADQADYVSTLLIENSGKPLEPIEKARAFKRLKDLGWEDTRIAYQTSPPMTAAQVSNYLLLSQVDGNKKILKALKDGKIEATTVMQLARKTKSKDGTVNLEKLEGLVTGAIEAAEGAGRKKATGTIAEQVRALEEQVAGQQGALPGTEGEGETEEKPQVAVAPKLKKGEAALLLKFRDAMKEVWYDAHLANPKSKAKTIEVNIVESKIKLSRDDFNALEEYMNELEPAETEEE
jgi:hypothetical protein